MAMSMAVTVFKMMRQWQHGDFHKAAPAPVYI